MTSKGSIKSNDFSRGANNHGNVTQEQKKAARAALLEKARKQSQK
ncbi:hypothetical protein [Weissella muntiaci]|nr:hypothetical protein [Weissella muntiaci]